MTRRLVLLIGLVLCAACAAAARAETVRFPGRDVMLSGEMVRPNGPGPFPAVVALHGCGGLAGKHDILNPRHRDWANRLVALGYIVLLPDSFGSRGAGPQCKTDQRVTRPSRERVDDALAAKNYLQSRPDVKPGAVSLLGWSNGGSSVLYAVKAGREDASGKPDFAAAVAFYPGCRVPAREAHWHARLPLLILIGAADDWTPADACQALAQNASRAGEPVSIEVYPDAYHDFDAPDLPVHLNTGLAYTAGGDGAAHSGTNPAARAAAIARVRAFLAR